MGICNVDSKYTDLQPLLFAFLRLHHVRCTFIKLSFCWSCSTLTYCHLHQPSCSLFNQTLSLSPSPPPFLTINTVLMGFTAIHKCVGGLPFTHIKFQYIKVGLLQIERVKGKMLVGFVIFSKEQTELSTHVENIQKRQRLFGSLQLLPGALISICKPVTQKGQSVKSDICMFISISESINIITMSSLSSLIVLSCFHKIIVTLLGCNSRRNVMNFHSNVILRH